MTLRTAEMSYELTLRVVTDEVDIELDECNQGCIVNAYQYDSSSSDTVLIGLGRTGKTIAVALGKVHLSRLQLGTEQCFGYRRELSAVPKPTVQWWTSACVVQPPY
jgi:hypothetical protein